MGYRFQNEIEKIKEYLKEWFTSHSDRYEDYNEMLHRIHEADKKLKEDRRIKIAIAGRMNTGKSMLIDNLFFGGRGIVNSSETPSTARLTSLYYSLENYAEVTFFSSYDLEELDSFAVRFRKQNEESYKFADDLMNEIDQSMKNHSEIKSLLGTKKKISIHKSKDLKEYSDVGGTYTALVKSIDLYCNEEILKTIEIIDTPGIGDPVLSRERITNDKVKEVDIVIFLSSASSFMDDDDMEYLLFLKDLGISNIIVLASRFDELLMDVDLSDVADMAQTDDFDTIKDSFITRFQKKLEEKCYGNEYRIADMYPSCPLIAKVKFMMDHIDMFNDEEIDRMRFYQYQYEGELNIDFSTDHYALLSGLPKIKNRMSRIEDERDQVLFESKKATVIQCYNLIEELYGKDLSELNLKKSTLEMVIANPSNMQNIITEIKLFGEKYKNAFNKAYIDAREKYLDPKSRSIKEIINDYITNAKTAIESAKLPRDIRNANEILNNNLNKLITLSIDDHYELSNGKLYNKFTEVLSQYLSEIKLTSIDARMNELVIKTLNNLGETVQSEYRTWLSREIGILIHKTFDLTEINQKTMETDKVISDSAKDLKTSYHLFENGERRQIENNASIKRKCKASIDKFAVDIYSRVNQLTDFDLNNSFKNIIKNMNTILEGKQAVLFSLLNEENINTATMELKEIENEIGQLEKSLNLIKKNIKLMESEVC